MSHGVEGIGKRFMYLELKGQKMHFLVNAYPPKPLILVTSNVKIYNLVNAVLG